MFKTETRTMINVPQGYLNAEDTIQLMQRVQEMQLRSKKEGLSSYGGADFDALLKEMAAQVTEEFAAMRTQIKSMQEGEE